MFIDFIYSIPNYLLLILVWTAFGIFALFGLVLSNRLATKSKYLEDSAALGAMARPSAAIFAVLVTFVAIATLTAFNKARQLVIEEAIVINAITHQADALPLAVTKDIYEAMEGYIDSVVKDEWPSMRRGEKNLESKKYLNIVFLHANQYHFDNNTQQLIFGQLMEKMGQLFQIHRERVMMAEEAIPGVVWAVLITCALLTIMTTFFFKLQSHKAQYGMTMSIALAVASLIFLILAFDRPFRGGTAILPAPLLWQLQDMQHPRPLPEGMSAKFIQP